MAKGKAAGVRWGTALALLGGAMLLGNSVAARADVIYSDFGGAQSYNGTAAWDVLGSANIPYGFQAMGQAFTPAKDYSLTGADVAVGAMPYTTGTSGTASIWTSSSGGLPDTQLGNSVALTFPSTAAVLSLSGFGTVSLKAGQTYFLVLQPGTTTTEGYWYYNDQSVNGLVGKHSSWYAANSDPSAAFDVTGTSNSSTVPEPASLSILGIALAGLGLSRRRRQSTRE